MSEGCDTCPYSPSCTDEERFACDIGIHDWTDRGAGDDHWRECYFCGEQVDADDDPTTAPTTRPHDAEETAK